MVSVSNHERLCEFCVLTSNFYLLSSNFFYLGGRQRYAAAVDFLASTSPNTCTAFCISSIVPSEMRAWVWWNGGKSRATMTFFARQASRNALAGVPVLTNMKFAWQSVGFMPRSANHFVTMSRTALLRLRSLAVKLASC